jgi:hypothetical protein
VDEAETPFVRSLELSRQLDARACELRNRDRFAIDVRFRGQSGGHLAGRTK